MHPRLTEDLITAKAESSWNETHSKWDQWATAPLSEKRYHAEDTEEYLSWLFYKIDKDNLRREKRDARAAKKWVSTAVALGAEARIEKGAGLSGKMDSTRSLQK